MILGFTAGDDGCTPQQMSDTVDVIAEFKHVLWLQDTILPKSIASMPVSKKIFTRRFFWWYVRI